jgi:hypothetical protein
MFSASRGPTARHNTLKEIRSRVAVAKAHNSCRAAFVRNIPKGLEAATLGRNLLSNLLSNLLFLPQVHQRTKNSVLLVADFGRLRPDEASLQKDVVIPYVHRVPTFAPLEEQEAPPERDLLLFFAGNRFRKEVRGGILVVSQCALVYFVFSVVVTCLFRSVESRNGALAAFVSGDRRHPGVFSLPVVATSSF